MERKEPPKEHGPESTEPKREGRDPNPNPKQLSRQDKSNLIVLPRFGHVGPGAGAGRTLPASPVLLYWMDWIGCFLFFFPFLFILILMVEWSGVMECWSVAWLNLIGPVQCPTFHSFLSYVLGSAQESHPRPECSRVGSLSLYAVGSHRGCVEGCPHCWIGSLRRGSAPLPRGHWPPQQLSYLQRNRTLAFPWRSLAPFTVSRGDLGNGLANWFYSKDAKIPFRLFHSFLELRHNIIWQYRHNICQAVVNWK